MITDLWRHEAGKYFCISTKTRDDVWHDEFFSRAELGEVEDYVREHIDRNVYFCPHGLSARRRVKENAVLPSLLWADMDKADPRKCKWKPTIAIQSSPGRYVGLWECNDEVTEDLNKRLTYAIGADKSGHDLTQVLRLPGTFNYKYKPAPVAKLLWDDGPEYSVGDLSRTLPKLEERKPKAAAVVHVKASASVKELMRAYSVKNIYMGHAGDRSRAIYGIWRPMVEGGATLDQIMQVLEASRSWQSKLAEGGSWCDEEIERIESAMG